MNRHYIIGLIVFLCLPLVSSLDPSYSLGMQNISQRIYSANTTLMFIGDSITAQNAYPRVNFYGAIREFKPIYWKGYYISSAQGSEEASAAFNCPTSVANVTAMSPGDTYPGGGKGYNVMAANAYNLTGDISFGTVGCRYLLVNTEFSSWYQDWSDNASLFTRYHYVGTNRTTPWSYYREYRNGTTDFNPGTLVFFNTTNTNSTWVQGLNFTPSTGTAGLLGQNLIAGLWDENASGLTNYFPLGMRMYRSDIPYGFQIGYSGDGGWTTEMHMGNNISHNYSDEGLRTYMQVNDVNTFAIWIGTNQGPNEWDGSTPNLYQSNVASIINRYIRVYYTQNITSDKPYFILISPWDLGDADGRMQAYENALINLTRQQTTYPNIAANATVGIIKLKTIINATNGTYSNWQDDYLSDGVHENGNGSRQFARYLWAEINKSIAPFKGKSGNVNFTVQTYTLWNRTLDTNTILFNNTDIYRQQVNLTNLTNPLIYDENLTALCVSTSNCSIASNVTIRNQSTVYVLDNFNVTEGVPRNSSPLWYSNSTSTFKSIASNITSTLNTSVAFNVTSCSIDRIVYVSHTGAYQYNYTSGQFDCSNSVALIQNVPLETASGSNNFTITYTSGGGTNGTGGSGSGSSGSARLVEYAINDQNLTDGFSGSLPVGGAYRFFILNENHSIKLNQFNATEATITVQSTPFKKALLINDSTDIDIDHDTLADIVVTYTGISVGRAKITIRRFLILNRTEEPKIDAVQKAPEIPKSNHRGFAVTTIMLSALMISVVIYIIYKSRKIRAIENAHYLS